MCPAIETGRWDALLDPPFLLFLVAPDYSQPSLSRPSSPGTHPGIPSHRSRRQDSKPGSRTTPIKEQPRFHDLVHCTVSSLSRPPAFSPPPRHFWAAKPMKPFSVTAPAQKETLPPQSFSPAQPELQPRAVLNSDRLGCRARSSARLNTRPCEPKHGFPIEPNPPCKPLKRNHF